MYSAWLKSHSLIEASIDPVATQLSSTCRHLTLLKWPSSIPIHLPALRSQTRTVSSRAAVTIVPNGESKSNAVIISLCAGISRICEPGSMYSCSTGIETFRGVRGAFFLFALGVSLPSVLGSFPYTDSDMKDASMPLGLFSPASAFSAVVSPGTGVWDSSAIASSSSSCITSSFSARSPTSCSRSCSSCSSPARRSNTTFRMVLRFEIFVSISLISLEHIVFRIPIICSL